MGPFAALRQAWNRRVHPITIVNFNPVDEDDDDEDEPDDSPGRGRLLASPILTAAFAGVALGIGFVGGGRGWYAVGGLLTIAAVGG